MKKTTISGERGETRPFLQRATDAIVDSAYAFYYTAQNLIIGLIYALPFIIGIGLVIGVIYYINKKRNKPK
ncbi:hypothetical protein [Marinilactibacillus kalidii]|uniref:hypothetical protein n=1 Tax=Marinilactibacillus kalidii TaxID=2820274 RepID=UPI001ABDA080|nr:hypothetical protein [Marinilactibacillus kalidii]